MFTNLAAKKDDKVVETVAKKDTSRMKAILLALKNDTKAPGYSGTTIVA
jgi:hypothetical protein